MSQVDDDHALGPMVRTMQIIIIGLTMGLVFFLGTVLFPRMQPKPAPPLAVPNPQGAQSLPVISFAAVGFAVMAVPMSLLIPGVLVRNSRQQIVRGTWTLPRGAAPPGPFGDTFRLLTVYQTSLIMGAALNEGPAFFALIAYMLEGLPAALGLAALLIVGVAARFPTRARVEAWIDAQKELMVQERASGL